MKASSVNSLDRVGPQLKKMWMKGCVTITHKCFDKLLYLNFLSAISVGFSAENSEFQKQNTVMKLENSNVKTVQSINSLEKTQD